MDGSLVFPLQPTPLIGRDPDLIRAVNLLCAPHVRMLTVTGPAGVGKTRLAVEVASLLIDRFPDGAAFVDLAPLAGPELLIATIATTLGMSEAPSQPLIETLTRGIGTKRLLLLLDNLEHLLDATPDVAHILTTCPGLSVLSTSRTPLRLRWEHVFDVSPLAPPDAAALLLDRSRAAGGDIDSSDPATIDAICARLDRLPLAIELAAPRTRTMSPAVLLARLERVLDTLADGPRDLPARQRTLRDAIAWSYDLLTPPEQMLFCRLAIFPAGCTDEAAAALLPLRDDTTAPSSPPSSSLAALVDAGLLRYSTGPDGAVRYRMLETVREYAWERLHAEDDPVAARRTGAAYLLALAESADPHLRSGGRVPWLARLDAELDNLRAALTWCEQDPASLETGLRLAAALEWFWHFRNHWREGFERTEALLSRTDDGSADGARLAALRVSGRFAVFLRRHAVARARLEEAAVMADSSGQPRIRAFALIFLTRLAWQEGTPLTEQVPLAAESVAILRRDDDFWWLALALFYLGNTHRYIGDPVLARPAAEESITLFRRFDDGWGVTLSSEILVFLATREGNWAAARRIAEEDVAFLRPLGEKLALATRLQMLGDLTRLAGDYPGAETALVESLTLHREIANTGGEANLLRDLAYVAVAKGDKRRAGVLYREGLALIREDTDALRFARFLIGLADLAVEIGLSEQAARLLAAAEAHVEAAGAKLGPVATHDLTRVIALVQTHLDDASFMAAWAKGSALSRSQAIAEATDVTMLCGLDEEPVATAAEAPPRRSRRGSSPDGLTPRESEILALLARGRSNREIATDLIVSIRTVEHHIARLYAKIGAHRRADAAAYAVHHGLVRLDQTSV